MSETLRLMWAGIAWCTVVIFTNALPATAHPVVTALALPTRLTFDPDRIPVVAVDARGDVAALFGQDLIVEWPSGGARIVFPKPKPAPSWPEAYYNFGALGPHGDAYAGITSWTEGAGFAHSTKYYVYRGLKARALKFPCADPALPEFVAADGTIGMTQDFVTDFHSLDDPPRAPDAMIVRGSRCIDLGASFLLAARGRYIAGFAPVMSAAKPGQYLDALPTRAVRYTDLKSRDLGPGQAFAVNAAGTCVGADDRYDHPRYDDAGHLMNGHATAWYADGKTKRLVTGDVSSAALAIGDDGRVAGTLVDAKNKRYAFVTTSRGAAVKLDALIGDPHWHFMYANAITNDGSIVGIGEHDGALALFTYRA